MYDAGIDLEKEPIQSTQNIKVKPTVKGPTKIFLMVTLLAISAGATYSIISKGKQQPDSYKLPNQQISQEVEATPSPTTTPEPVEDLVDGEATLDKQADLKTLMNTATKELNNHYYATRNFFLGKARDQVEEGGRNYEYYLLIELKRIKSELSKELVKNNEKSVSGIGGEFGANAEHRKRVRAIYGDLMGLILAFDYIYQMPDQLKPDPDALITRVSIGETLNNILDFEVTVSRLMQSETFQTIERAKDRYTANQELIKDTQQLKETLKNETKP